MASPAVFSNWSRRRIVTVIAVLILTALGLAIIGAVAIRQSDEIRALAFQVSSLRTEIDALRKRELEARRIDTTPKRDTWLFTNELLEILGDLKRPRNLAGSRLKAWNEAYTPRKGNSYDVAAVEWRLSGRTKKLGGEELAEVLWVATVVNAARVTGFDMTLDLEFLDSRGFRIAKSRGQGYIFPMDQDDDGLPHVTKLRGDFWAPLRMAREIKEVTGVWNASPGF